MSAPPRHTESSLYQITHSRNNVTAFSGTVIHRNVNNVTMYKAKAKTLGRKAKVKGQGQFFGLQLGQRQGAVICN